MIILTLAAIAAISLLAGCANTEYKSFDARNNVFQGAGGTKILVEGMDFWDNGDPPRKFRVLGIIDDERSAGLIPMSQLRGDMVKKAREVGGDAVVQISSQSQIAGYYTSGSASVYASGSSAAAYGSSTTVPVARNVSRFAVIKYLDQ